VSLRCRFKDISTQADVLDSDGSSVSGASCGGNEVLSEDDHEFD